MTASCSSRSWRPIRPCEDVEGDPGGHVDARTSCTPTRATTSVAAAAICTDVGSKCGSRAAGSRTNPSSAGSAVIERTISWPLRFKRLGLRYDRTERTTRPLLTLACAVINLRRLINTEF
jgi:hypothetical protein